MRVLIACEYSGRTREAFRSFGHDVISCDLLPSEDSSPHHVIGNVFDVIRERGPFDLMIAHPPCTYLANSGVRWLASTPGRFSAMQDAAGFFASLLLADIAKIAVENPIMHGIGRREISNLVGYPIEAHYVQPWWFGDRAFKATGFTLKGLEPLVEDRTSLRAVVPKFGTAEHKAWSQIHNMPPGPNRWKDRSRTYPGIARAMAEQWG